MTDTKNKQRIVIVGGGFGGVKAALELSKHDNFAVTLVSDRADFWYYPTLYHTATGMSRDLSVIPLKHLFNNKPVEIIYACVNGLDRAAKTVTLDKGEPIAYDSLILALGVITNFFGIPGLQEFAYGIKTIDEAERFKKHLHEQVTSEHKPDLNYVVVGGGATGIELAGNLGHYIHYIMKHHGISDRKVHVDLVEGAPHLMPRMPKAVGKAIEKQLRSLSVRLYLDTKVEGLSADALTVSGKPIRSHTVIWTAGMANNPFFAQNDFVITDHRKVQVDEFLRAEKGIYVIGDNADTPFSGMAQTAIYDAEFVAHNLVKEAENEPKLAYRPKKPVYVTPAGPNWAAVEWGKFHVYGKLGWFLRQAGDLVAFHDIENPIDTIEQYAHVFEHQDLCPVCQAVA